MWPYSRLAAIAILALSHALLLYPTLRPNVQWLGPVITHFTTTRNELWLTIDDGPTDDTRELLALFEAKNARVTFFVKGALARAHPELIREMLAHGHSVANHSDTHPSGSFWMLPPHVVAREIDRCNDALQTITGHAPRWFRAPVGMKNPGVHPQLARRQMRLIGWSVRAFDAVVTSVETVVRRLTPGFAPGAILVMHQGRRGANGESLSAEMLRAVVEAGQSRGFEFVIPADDQLVAGRRNVNR
jgi:peptidoglycan/xylan/chitin deacetylase (PgdA/CDA1 family)